MKLNEYLEKNNLTQLAFAKLIGASPSALNNWLAGRHAPRTKQLQRIKDATKGKVMPNDFL